ncbi:hypothetical protein [Halorussus salinus]|uniref:hypothetical protein n=1 Tax=Halorussus salinus TaxID=1364935 RepID=UPI00138F5AEE|nr:hypothetical protein [Halorussus salinus]
MGSDNDRGWNIVLGRARNSLTASLLGASRDGELALLDLLLLMVVGALATKAFGVW